jgi:hypothetical protein
MTHDHVTMACRAVSTAVSDHDQVWGANMLALLCDLRFRMLSRAGLIVSRDTLRIWRNPNHDTARGLTAVLGRGRVGRQRPVRDASSQALRRGANTLRAQSAEEGTRSLAHRLDHLHRRAASPT